MLITLSYKAGPTLKNLVPRSERSLIELSRYLMGVSTKITRMKLIKSIAFNAPKKTPPIRSIKETTSTLIILVKNISPTLNKNIIMREMIVKLSKLHIAIEKGVSLFMT